MSQTNELKVAIIGLGTIGRTVATNLTKGNRSVILASRDSTTAQNLANELGSFAQPSEIPAAIQQADILILAIWFTSIQEFLNQYAAELDGKLIIDPSNPISPNEKSSRQTCHPSRGKRKTVITSPLHRSWKANTFSSLSALW